MNHHYDTASCLLSADGGEDDENRFDSAPILSPGLKTIDYDELEVGNIIGEGSFGVVYAGM